jgi:hypothetical protein
MSDTASNDNVEIRCFISVNGTPVIAPQGWNADVGVTDKCKKLLAKSVSEE